MRILFAHTNFPAQFGAFGAWLATQGWDVVFATARSGAEPPAGCRMLRFQTARDGAPETHRHGRGLDRALRTAESFAVVAAKARQSGLAPDVVVAHSGWGAGTYAKAVWPEARFAPYVEWWYRHPRADAHPAEPDPADPAATRARAVSRNAPMLLDLATADAVLCPTQFQAAQFPDWIRARFTVMHDGVDAAALAPDPAGRARLIGELGLPAEAEIVSYAARGMEPYRGFPEFLRAVAALQKRRPRLHAVIAGEDRVVYGESLPEGESWKRRVLAALDLDPARLHFVGHVPPARLRVMMQGADLHVYLTLPFVLSWSMIEAMSVGCRLVVSDVAPVREALGGRDAAILVDHHDPDALVAAIARGLDEREAGARRGAAARARVLAAYDRRWLWPARAAFLETLAQGRA